MSVSCVAAAVIRTVCDQSLSCHVWHSLEPVYFEIATVNVRKELHMAVLFLASLDKPRKRALCQEVGLAITFKVLVTAN